MNMKACLGLMLFHLFIVKLLRIFVRQLIPCLEKRFGSRMHSRGSPLHCAKKKRITLLNGLGMGQESLRLEQINARSDSIVSTSFDLHSLTRKRKTESLWSPFRMEV